MDLAEILTAMHADLRRVEERLHQEVDVEYPFVGDILQGLIEAGGKRLRPLVLLLSAKLFDYDLERLLPAAAGVELLHTASLIHDDTVDRSGLRRGRPTLNSLFDQGTVILLGDYVFARSAMLAAETMNPRVVAVFASSLADICDGQLSEIFSAHQLEQTLDQYQRRIYGKTASLFAGSAEMGAILSGANDEQVAALRCYGRNIGMAFQIVDDVLDLRETTDHIGKPSSLDLRQGTVTLPTMLFLEHHDHSGQEADLVRRTVNGDSASDEDYAVATAVIRESGALERAVAIAEEYVASAKGALQQLPVCKAWCMLEALADRSVHRTR